MKDNKLYLDKIDKQILMEALYEYHLYITDKLKEDNDPVYSMLSNKVDKLYHTLKTQIEED